MKSKLGVVVLWILVFLLGGVAGAVGYHLYHYNAKHKNEDFMKELAQDLKLDAQQTESLKAIFEESLKQYRALNEEFRPRFKAVRNETDEKIKKILRPEQILRYEERLEKFRKQGSTKHPPEEPSTQKH